MDEAPASGFGFKEFDGVSYSSNPIPAMGFNGTKPGAAKAGVGDDDGFDVVGDDGFEL